MHERVQMITQPVQNSAEKCVLSFLLNNNSGESRASQEVRPLRDRFGKGLGLLRVRIRLRVQVRVRPPLQQTAQRVRSTVIISKPRCNVETHKMNEIVAIILCLLAYNQ